jgi:hypothetical protein
MTPRYVRAALGTVRERLRRGPDTAAYPDRPHGRPGQHPGARLLLRLTAGAAIGALLGGVVAQAAQPATAASADQSSAVTASGRGEFAGMKFTVGQTKHLTSQGVSVSWTGGTPTTFAGTQFNTDFVQIMQCWGADDGTVPSNPGPPRTQCEYGASPTTGRSTWPGNGYDDTRAVIYSADPANYGRDDRYGAGGNFGQGEVPFKSVDGTMITNSTQNNALYSYNTTNEVDFARTGADGTGQQNFEMQTANEAPQLGCGGAVRTSGVTKPRSCWLVIVPQGHLDLDGKPYADPTQVNAGSPVSSTNWQNRIAIKLDFNLVGNSCALGSNERATTGSELAADAMTSWQASLCSTGTVFGYTQLGEPDARNELISNGSAGMVFTTRALGSDYGTSAPTGKTSYAPVAVAGAVIGFTIERRAKSTAPESVQKQSGTKVQSIDLTPRLVAKLLTESYRSSTWGSVTTQHSGGTSTQKAAKGYAWTLNNPAGLVSDPEFVHYNPEFANLAVAENPGTDTDLITALGRSDTARQLWAYVESDKTARQFLAGVPDDWGMRVNPYYSTNPDLNPTGIAFDTSLDSYPKSDPWCTIPANSGATDKQCMTDFHPYVDDMHSGALHTLRADTLWKSTWNPLASPPAWQSPGPQTVGQRFVLTITDAASAARYGLQTARLLNASGKFVAPTTTALTVAAATASSTGSGVSPVDPATKKAKNAYPLTELVYAATRPAELKAAARQDYAQLLRYAAGAGQTTGSNPGELPPGYAPLSKALRAKTLSAATVLADWKTTSNSSTSSSGTTATGGTTNNTTGNGSTSGTTGATTPNASANASAGPSSSASYGGGTAVETTATGTTPADPANALRYAVPVGAALGLLAAFGAPLAGGAGLRSLPLPLRLNLPGGRTVTVLPRLTLPGRLRRLRVPGRGGKDGTPLG